MPLRPQTARHARLAASWSRRFATSERRWLSSTSSRPAFQTSEGAGIKLATKDTSGPTTRLAVVAKSGTRFEPLPGLTVGLEEFCFKNTEKRSALRITREAELLGGQLSAYHTREALVVAASFLRSDLPYFVELLAEVVSSTKYTSHELHEDVERVIALKQAAYCSSAANLALDFAHSVAFHNGLGAPMYPSIGSSYKKYSHEHLLASFAQTVFAPSNFSVVCDGASSEAVNKWTTQFFGGIEASSEETGSSAKNTLDLETAQSTYFGGEHRHNLASGNSMVIAFPGTGYDGAKPELSVLAALLGGESSIKWSPGSSVLSKATASLPGGTVTTKNIPYTDAGLLAIQISGSAGYVRQASLETAKSIKTIAEGSVGKEDVAKAIAKAKFDILDQSQLREQSMNLAGTGLAHMGKALEAGDLVKGVESVTPEKVKSAAKALVESKASVATVGDLFALPFATELGLKV